jgi:hypothetical protein
MDHTEAVRGNAAERYAIGDLPLVEVEEFERHFFECPQCSEELRALSILVTNARAVFSEPVMVAPPVIQPAAVPVASHPSVVEKVPAPKVRWWREPWVLGPAFAAMAVIAFISADPGLRTHAGKIEQVSAFPIYAAARGEETMVTPPGNSPSFMLYMDKTWESAPEFYLAEIRDETSNAPQASFTLKDPGAGHFLEISIPSRSLSPGRYILVVQDASNKNADLARYPFTLRVE